MRRTRVLVVGLGLAAGAFAAWWLFGLDAGATGNEGGDSSGSARAAVPGKGAAKVVEPEHALLQAPDMPEDVRRKLQLLRLGHGLAEVQELVAQGKYAEALALLKELQQRSKTAFPDVKDVDKRIAVAQMGVQASQGVSDLAQEKAGAEASGIARAALQKRIDATRDVMARSNTTDDLEAFERHLRRFLLVDTDPKSTQRAEILLRAFLDDRRRRGTSVSRPPVADAEAAEQRRVDELERLRQRNAVGLLDAIHASLAWLALHQAEDGSWNDAQALARCKELKHDPPCVADRGDQGKRNTVAATALAALAFLDFRDQDVNGLFDPYLARAIQWLLKAQRPDGSWPAQSLMYETAMATMALGQAAASTGVPEIKDAVARALSWFEKSIARGGGYRYGPNAAAADLSVTAWVAQAIEASRGAGLEIPARITNGFEEFLKWCWLGTHRFSYVDGKTESRGLDAAGMLLVRVTGVPVDDATAADWTQFLQTWPPQQRPGIYALYYAVRLSILLNNRLDVPWRDWVIELASGKAKPQASPSGLLVPAGGLNAGPLIDHEFSTLTIEHALYLR